MKQLVVGFALSLSSIWCCALWAETVSVAVASNFSAVMTKIATEFEVETGHKANLSFGSSGKFFAQVQNGAPFQVFFSADQAKPLALEQAGQVVAGSRFTYALGALALWSRQPGLVDQQGLVLKQGNFNRLSLANPKLAPYGAAAQEVLQNLDLVNATQKKWVRGENISQTFQFVASGNVDVGFVALSQVMARLKNPGHAGSYWLVPAALYSPIRQDAVLLQKGHDSPAAKALLQFVKGPKAQQIIAASGYQVP